MIQSSVQFLLCCICCLVLFFSQVFIERILEKHFHGVEKKKEDYYEMLQSNPLQEEIAGCSCEMHKRSKKKANDNTFVSELHATCPKLADSDPKGRHVSIIKGCV